MSDDKPVEAPAVRLVTDPKSGLAIDASAPNSPQPAQGGWAPPFWLPLVFVGIGGGLAAALPFVTGPALIIIQVSLGLVTSIGAALGIQSAGPRK